MAVAKSRIEDMKHFRPCTGPNDRHLRCRSRPITNACRAESDLRNILRNLLRTLKPGGYIHYDELE